MCDEQTVKDNAAYLKRQDRISRRTFATLAGSAAVVAGLGVVGETALAETVEVVEENIKVTTPDGVADCYFVRPVKGKHAAVIVWPDIVGLRPAYKTMGKRLAESGYAVLVVNPYYRKATAPVVPAGSSFQDQSVRDTIFPLARSLSAKTNVVDAKAFVKFLDQQPSVDTGRKIGTTGYCMGGSMVMRTAATLPERIGAGATFHGGGLATDADDSPHLLVPKMKASFMFAIAGNDDEKDPKAKELLKAAYETADLPAEIKVYEGTLHGWCALDSAVYNQAAANHAHTRLLALFDKALA
ncbi:MAG: dienelactone hydrolase [Robiginitomaculum sp.]|nr:MAG: dienelactone hydrolase [Robiginitomaculum sp.]